LILGDQLNSKHSWFSKKDSGVLYVLMEVKQESEYVKHHIQKIVGFFASMREFAGQLELKGHHVYYLNINDSDNKHSFDKNLDAIIIKFSVQKFEYQLPDEYRLDRQLKKYCDGIKIDHQVYDTEHFYTQRDELKDMFKARVQYRMEHFYRVMRRKHDVLMNNDKPEGGDWNYDKRNRERYDDKIKVPALPDVKSNVAGVLQDIQKAQLPNFGFIDAKRFTWPANRTQSRKLLRHFMTHCLPHFGTYQDAMDSRYDLLFHSRLSFALNTKQLSPSEVIEAAVGEWKKRKKEISLPQVEGFVRQILGWREYMRGVYWAEMPEYESMNFFSHTGKLPEFYWTGETRMHCMHKAITQSLQTAYAHHIQRLMVTGNFALLAGIHPDEVDAWYLGIYIDAVQWVEITNTRGMSQYADGGIVGSKPYVSSAQYINKMSNYCDDCYYKKSEKIGERACPFNSLYWHFYERNRELLQNNPRVGMMYRVLDKLRDKDKILKQAETYLENIENL
jgi:deoxyribodipyrimidine photolyase-related protein